MDDKIKAYVPGLDSKRSSLLAVGGSASALGKISVLLDLIQLID